MLEQHEMVKFFSWLPRWESRKVHETSINRKPRVYEVDQYKQQELFTPHSSDAPRNTALERRKAAPLNSINCLGEIDFYKGETYSLRTLLIAKPPFIVVLRCSPFCAFQKYQYIFDPRGIECRFSTVHPNATQKRLKFGMVVQPHVGLSGKRSAEGQGKKWLAIVLCCIVALAGFLRKAAGQTDETGKRTVRHRLMVDEGAFLGFNCLPIPVPRVQPNRLQTSFSPSHHFCDFCEFRFRKCNLNNTVPW